MKKGKAPVNLVILGFIYFSKPQLFQLLFALYA
jgi:hypothetical protein